MQLDEQEKLQMDPQGEALTLSSYVESEKSNRR